MADEPDSVEEANRRLMQALVRARESIGLKHRVEMARRMDAATGGRGPEASTYNRWEEGTRRVPGWALLVASRVSGLSPDELLQPDEPGLVDRVAALEKRLTTVAAQVQGLVQSERPIGVTEIREVLTALGKVNQKTGEPLSLGRVSNLTKRRDFPTFLEASARGRLWRREDVRRWAQDWDQREGPPPGPRRRRRVQ